MTVIVTSRTKHDIEEIEMSSADWAPVVIASIQNRHGQLGLFSSFPSIFIIQDLALQCI